MKQIFFLILFVVSILSKADEGMWLFTMLDKLGLENKGCKLTPEQIYSVNNSSLKDGLIGLGSTTYSGGFFCTAELVSSNGLVLTNYHCAFDMIQSHTNLDNNYIENGFWAKSNSEELKNEDITASFFIKMEDVTNFILQDSIKNKPFTVKKEYIETLIDSLSDSLSKTSGLTVLVNSFFENTAFYAFYYKTYKDIRLTAAPARSIGKYGGDIDNWMWPRHTGDFCFLRIYTDKNGNPAEYDTANIPLQTSKNLKISLQGYAEGDFSMIMGFPGSTDRNITSYGVQSLREIDNKNAIIIRTKKLDIIRKYTEINEKIRIQYAAKIDHTSNYWKYYIGQNKGIRRLNTIQEKEKEEKEIYLWIQNNDSLQKKYGKTMESFKQSYADREYYKQIYSYIMEAVFNSPEIFGIAYDFIPLKILLEEKKKGEELTKEIEKLKIAVEAYFKDYNVMVDKELTKELLKLYADSLSPDMMPDLFKKIAKKNNNDFSSYTEKLFKKSILTSKNKTLAFLDNPKLSKLKNDMAYQAMRSSLLKLRQVNSFLSKDSMLPVAKENLIELKKIYYHDSLIYPDANSTPRFSYGQIIGYSPYDAVSYQYFSTQHGILEKADSTMYDFDISDDLIKNLKSNNFGNYSKNDTLQVCFLSNNDITGGNSGSPVLNARGELIGIAFDGNWEAMTGDIIFNPLLQRTISVDIRYVLYIVEKIGNCRYLIDEMDIVQ